MRETKEQRIGSGSRWRCKEEAGTKEREEKRPEQKRIWETCYSGGQLIWCWFANGGKYHLAISTWRRANFVSSWMHTMQNFKKLKVHPRILLSCSGIPLLKYTVISLGKTWGHAKVVSLMLQQLAEHVIIWFIICTLLKWAHSFQQPEVGVIEKEALY